MSETYFYYEDEAFHERNEGPEEISSGKAARMTGLDISECIVRVTETSETFCTSSDGMPGYCLIVPKDDPPPPARTVANAFYASWHVMRCWWESE